MTGTIVHRHHFTLEEVVALLLPTIERSSSQEMRVDADGYLIIDLIAPVEARGLEAEAGALAQNSNPPTADTPALTSSEEPAERPKGPVEMEAVLFCKRRAVQTFLDVDTEGAALVALAKRCRVENLSKLDAGKSFAANFRDVAAEFEAWMLS